MDGWIDSRYLGNVFLSDVGCPPQVVYMLLSMSRKDSNITEETGNISSTIYAATTLSIFHFCSYFFYKIKPCLLACFSL